MFGTYASAEYILNVCGFLILAGIILDKMGVRFTGILSTSLMVVGACIKLVGVSEWFQTTAFCDWLNSWWVAMPGSAKMASLGFMVFGCGCEMAGTTVSKALAKWFKGKEMALAMGLEMAIARLGVFAVMWLSPAIAGKFDSSVVAPVAFCTLLLLVGLINFIVFSVMDSKFDKQLVAAGLATDEKIARRRVPRARPRKDILQQDVLAGGPALRALLFGHLPLPEIRPQLSRSDPRSGRGDGFKAVQLLPDTGHVPDAASRHLPRPQG